MNGWNHRNNTIINFLYRAIWPLIKVVFRIEVKGTEHLSQINQPLLFISNHNSGALIESFTALMILKLHHPRLVFGFTHPSIFKVPLISQYFQVLGAVPATYDVAREVFNEKHSLLIFPGGNSQALRTVWKYKDNHFRYSRGWSKIAQENKIAVMPITFRNTHFINPVLLSGGWVSKLMILPKLLGLKVASISLGQILTALLIWIVAQQMHSPLWLTISLSYLGFIISPLTPVIPVKVILQFHPVSESESHSREQLEERVNLIMDKIYE